MFKQTYVHPVSQRRYGEWAWCVRCEHAYHTAQWFANHWFCPHPGCDGTARDSSRWGHKHERPFALNPQYPAVPVEGQRYAGAYTGSLQKPALRPSPQMFGRAIRISQRAKFALLERFGQVVLAVSQQMEIHRATQKPRHVLELDRHFGRGHPAQIDGKTSLQADGGK
jgi:hypothetical protein